MRRGCRMLRVIFATPPLAEHVIAELAPGTGCGMPMSEWEDYLRSDSVTIFHPCGTCKMGVDAEAVVDPRPAPARRRRLHVIDASIMPHLVSGNINAPVIMIGERGADLVLEQYPWISFRRLIASG